MNATEDGFEPVGEGPIDTLAAVDRMAELGMLAGADYVKGLAREVFRSRIGTLIAVFDKHDPGIYRGAHIETGADMYRCPDGCGGFIGTEAEWKRHLADKLADALAGE